MRRTFEDDLRDRFDELANAMDVELRPFEGGFESDVSAGRRRLGPILATAAVAILVIVGFVLLARPSGVVQTHDPSTRSGVAVSASPSLLTVGEGGLDMAVSDFVRQQLPFIIVHGAVVAPDGTVFGLAVDEKTNQTFEGTRLSVGGFEMIVQPGGDDQVVRHLDLGCMVLGITTVGAAVTDDQLEALLDAMAVEGATVAIDSPEGWESLGAGSSAAFDSYDSFIRLETGPYAGTELILQQAPGAPVGYSLWPFGIAPILLSDTGTDQLWHTRSFPEEVSNGLVGIQHDTTFSLQGDVPVEVLQAIADALVPVDSDTALETRELAPPNVTIEKDESASSVTTSPDCSTSTPQLTIRS